MLAVATATAAEPAARLARTNTPAAKQPGRAAEEKRACTKNLKTIYAAIEAYQIDRRDLPNWLSDLVPQYLPDASTLICPVCRRTGETEAPPLADPRLPCSYIFEFCPLPLRPNASGDSGHTRREWRRRQMGLIGAQVPLVRCRHHRPVLNLSFDGKVYESPPRWELLFTNRVSAADLTVARLFVGEVESPAKGKKKGGARRFPARDPRAGKGLLNLTRFYNTQLNWAGPAKKGNALAALPKGLQTFGGVAFDVRGMIRLRGRFAPSTNLPPVIKGIPVKQKCQQIHFLHAAASNLATNGTRIGTYVIHFAANQWLLEIPIRYGHEVLSWHPVAGEPPPSKDLVAAWRGQGRNAGRTGRVFLTTWTNVAPGLEIESIDFVSTLAGPAPVLIAITVD